MTMKKQQEGMLPAMKVNEKLQNNYITATKDIQDLQLQDILKLLWLKTGRIRVGRPSTYITISTIINRIMLKKGNLDDNKRNYTQLTLIWKLEEKSLKENTGSDKGK
jgi:DNA topoisomerase-1